MQTRDRIADSGGDICADVLEMKECVPNINLCCITMSSGFGFIYEIRGHRTIAQQHHHISDITADGDRETDAKREYRQTRQETSLLERKSYALLRMRNTTHDC